MSFCQQSPLPTRTALVEHLEITGDGFCGIHCQHARITVTVAISAPAGKLVTSDRGGSEHNFTPIAETSSAAIATGNARLIAVYDPTSRVKIAYYQCLTNRHLKTQRLRQCGIVIVIARLVGGYGASSCADSRDGNAAGMA